MNYKYKLALGSMLAFVIILSSIMMALSTLKQEAVNNYMTISKINATTFSQGLNQDINNIEQSIQTIAALLDVYTKEVDINNRLKNIQRSYAQIRSINIVQHNKILFSSNDDNLHLPFASGNFFPQPIFNDNILKISTPWVGRDFNDGKDLNNYQNNLQDNDSFFIPISKKIVSSHGTFNVVVNLNSDYFMHRFLNNLDSNHIHFELIRLDGMVLLSSNEFEKTGKEIKQSALLQGTIQKNEFTGIDEIDGKKHIVTYMLTADYPINLVVKLDYEQSLLSWNQRQYDFFMITTAIIIGSILLALFFFYLYNKKRDEEIALHKLQLQEQEKFKLLFQDTHFMAVIITKEGKIVDINHKALQFLGQKSEALKNVKFWQLKCWKKKERFFLAKMIKNFSQKNVQSNIVALNNKAQEATIEFSLSSLNVGQERMILAIGLDITLRKEREKKLQQAYTVFNNTRDGIMITDNKTRLLDVNLAFEKITGYYKEEVMYKKPNFLKSGLHDATFYKQMWKSIMRNGFWAGEIININKHKQEYVQWLTINVIYDNKGNVLNYIAVFSDITEQKNKERILRQKDELMSQQSKMAAMGEMIENIAHQWRQPLTVISSGATSILFQKEYNISTYEDEERTLIAINKSAQYLSQTIDDFRNFLKADKQRVRFNIKHAIDDAIALAITHSNCRDIQVVCNLDNIEVYGIKNELIQVIINILNNAKDALTSMQTQKFIFINGHESQNEIHITIQDNAGGIPTPIIDRIFEPYFTTKHKAQGTGIGLYMSEEIIRNHMKGTLSVQNSTYTFNEKEYEGACLSIKLPR